MNFLKNRPSIKFLVTKAALTFERFPFVLLSAALTAAYAIYLTGLKDIGDDPKLAATLALGIPLFLATALFRESKGWTAIKYRVADLLFGSAFLICHYFLTINDGTRNYYTRYFHLSLTLHLAVSFIAFIGKKDTRSFWQFNRHLFLRILLSALYASVLYGGLAIALITTNKLFDIEIKPERYLELWYVCALVFQTWHFLAGVPKLSELNEDESYPTGLRFFVQFMLIPLVSLYSVIMYCYMAKILITWDWPSGYIGWLVSVMSVLGIFNLLLIDPEKNRSENRWIAAYSKYYYILMIPLLGMLFAAVGKRVAEYGVTEHRYFLIVLGALLAGLAAYFIFSAKKSIKVIPVSLFLVGIISLWGPVSAYSYSQRNQRARAQKILEKYGFMSGNTMKPVAVSVSHPEETELSAVFDYLVQYHGPKSVADWFPTLTLSEKERSSETIMKYLGLNYADQYTRKSREEFSFESNIALKDFSLAEFHHGILYSFTAYSGKMHAMDVAGKKLTIEYERASGDLLVQDGGKAAGRFPLRSLVKKLTGAPTGEKAKTHQPVEEMFVESSGTPARMRLVLKSIYGEFDDGAPEVRGLDGVLLIQ